MFNNFTFNPIYIIFLLVIALLLYSYMDTFQLQQCVGRDLGTCVADINCEWDPYYNACANRTYNALPTGWGWGNVPWVRGWNDWARGWGNDWGWGREGRRGWDHRRVWGPRRV